MGIVLRPWEASPEDAAELARAWSDPGIAAETRPPVDRSPAAARAWIAGDPERRRRGLALDLVITMRQQPGGVLGEVGLANFDESGRVEIGFWLAPEARGRRVASSAVALLTQWAVSDDGLGRRQVWARVRPGNARAEAVLSRAGFTRLVEARGQVLWSCV